MHFWHIQTWYLWQTVQSLLQLVELNTLNPDGIKPVGLMQLLILYGYKHLLANIV